MMFSHVFRTCIISWKSFFIKRVQTLLLRSSARTFYDLLFGSLLCFLLGVPDGLVHLKVHLYLGTVFHRRLVVFYESQSLTEIVLFTLCVMEVCHIFLD